MNTTTVKSDIGLSTLNKGMQMRRSCMKLSVLMGTLILAVLLLSARDMLDESEDSPEDVTLTILYTNDEHGWIQESEETEGAAKLMGLLESEKDYNVDGPFLLLSGGDNWTGPAISTWFQGESTLEVMNAMGYDASAIGNHEFDFTVDGLMDRIEEADFPYLSANIREKASGLVPDFVTPYAILEIENIEVGLVGLTTITTPYTTFPAYVEDFDFISYEIALQEWVPKVWDAGAQIVLVLGHICHGEMIALLPTARKLGISMLGGGHCNDLVADVHGDVAVIAGGTRFQNYARLKIDYNYESETVTAMAAITITNSGGTANTDIRDIVQHWQDVVDQELGEVIGYAANEIDLDTWKMFNLVTDSWLAAFSLADISMYFTGGVRQTIPAGDITKETIVGVLPFTDQIIELHLTGLQVMQCPGSLFVGGMTSTDGFRHLDGSLVEEDSVYSLLTTDYLYQLSDMPFQGFDPEPYFTGLSYYQPIIDYIVSLNTSAEYPLDDHLDTTSRR